MNFSYDRGCVLCVVWLLMRYVISFGLFFFGLFNILFYCVLVVFSYLLIYVENLLFFFKSP